MDTNRYMSITVQVLGIVATVLSLIDVLVEQCVKGRTKEAVSIMEKGKEPNHLLSIFGKPLLITSGGYSREAGKETGVSKIALYQVRSTSSGSSKGIQVSTSASSLNSNDAFVLKGETECYVWMGKGANDTEIDAAKYIAGVLCNKTPNELKEGSESASFWKLIGGKKDYASSPRMLDLDANPPRLFAISNAKGRVTIEEIPGDFTQGDLETDDVMMLDAWDQVFIWVGNGANAEEQKEAPGLVKEYIEKDPRGRDPNCTIITIKMNSEPVTFTGFFPSWDVNLYEERGSYSDRMKKLYI